jgi:hypothetical protein
MKRSLPSGPPATWLRIVYNCRDGTELGVELWSVRIRGADVDATHPCRARGNGPGQLRRSGERGIFEIFRRTAGVANIRLFGAEG